MSELKPCPFCGCEKISYVVQNDLNMKEEFCAMCTVCEVKTAYYTTRYRTRDQACSIALNDWNTRTTPTISLEQLRETFKDESPEELLKLLTK